jgi:hypothetical protein
MILMLEKLLKIKIHAVVKADHWSAMIRGNPDYQLELKPMVENKNYLLVLYMNGQRTTRCWQLSSCEIRGRLNNGGSIPWGFESWYVVGWNGKRYRHLYVSPETQQFGTRHEICGRYRAQIISIKARKAAKDYRDALKEIRPGKKKKRLRMSEIGRL